MKTSVHSGINVITLTACICSLTGCDASERDGISGGSGTVVVTDSSGVRITEASAADAPTWSVGESPEIRIGSVEGDEPYLFDGIGAAFLLSDGRIVVADGGSRQLRYFSAEGEHTQTAGRQGQGPGEFQAFTAVLMTGDSLLVHDNRNDRLTTIGRDGTMVDEISGPELPGVARGILLGRISDDEFLFRSTVPLPIRRGYYRGTMSLALGRRGGTQADTLLRLPSRETVTTQDDQRRYLTRPHPFSPQAVAAVWNGEIVAGTGESYELGVYDSSGRLQALIRRSDAEVIPLEGSAALEEYMDAYRDAGGSAASARAGLDGFPEPRLIPSYSEFLVDDLGLLWVGDYVPFSFTRDMTPRSWTVFERSGRVVARAVTPAGFQPTHISEESMVGYGSGEFGVEYVSVYRFRRTGPG